MYWKTTESLLQSQSTFTRTSRAMFLLGASTAVTKKTFWGKWVMVPANMKISMLQSHLKWNKRYLSSSASWCLNLIIIIIIYLFLQYYRQIRWYNLLVEMSFQKKPYVPTGLARIKISQQFTMTAYTKQNKTNKTKNIYIIKVIRPYVIPRLIESRSAFF